MPHRLNRLGHGRTLWGTVLVLAWLTGCAGETRPRPPDGFLGAAPASGMPAETSAPARDAQGVAGAAAKNDATPKKAARAKPANLEDAPPAAAAAAPVEYRLQAGDEIALQIYREPALSGTFKLDPAGDVRHSLAGAIPLAGKTVAEAETFIAEKLDQDYLVNPRVIVKLLTTQSSQITVLGEVKAPGVYPLPFGGTTTLLQAIAGAGGFTDLASPDRVRIVRKLPNGRQTTLKIRVSDLLDGKGKQQDVPLEPNDVVMVPEVFF